MTENIDEKNLAQAPNQFPSHSRYDDKPESGQQEMRAAEHKKGILHRDSTAATAAKGDAEPCHRKDEVNGANQEIPLWLPPELPGRAAFRRMWIRLLGYVKRKCAAALSRQVGGRCCLRFANRPVRQARFAKPRGRT